MRDSVRSYGASEVLGHSSVATTGDIYGHVSPEVSASAMEVLSEALG
ncbi:hypothetical protein [Agromyces sp. Soil535]|nr:hypothetical protein [Agromyces sp. Soil535]